MKGSILLLDDDKLLLEFMDEYLSINDYRTFSFSSPPEAIDFLKENSVDLVITDVKMNEMTGDEVLSHVLANYPETGVIMITGFGNIGHCVNALRKGAYDYITKPFKANELTYRVNRYFDSDADEQSRNRGRRVSPRKDQTKRKRDRKSTRLNSSHVANSYAVVCVKKKKHNTSSTNTPHN